MADPKKKKKLPSGRHLSQIKRQKQNLKIAERNKSVLSEVRSFIRKVREAAVKKDVALATKALKDAIVKIDKAVSKGVLKRNHGSRKVSRLSKLVTSLGK